MPARLEQRAQLVEGAVHRCDLLGPQRLRVRLRIESDPSQPVSDGERPGRRQAHHPERFQRSRERRRRARRDETGLALDDVDATHARS